ncbi:MAG: DciA family protein [Candidatus Omnitrophica bacterium]|nr:DciA family protein [Candidatus Omnitrophota bacterium]
METIKDTIKNVMKGFKAQKNGDNPQGLLKKTLTKRELAHIKFNYFKKGVLGWNVDSSSWLYKLSLEKEDILQGLNKKNKTIKDIRFRIGEVK